MNKNRFYVYKFVENAECIYVGKGCKNRIKIQNRRFGFEGEIVKWFFSERQAYDFEKKLIKELKPVLNRNRGGGGTKKYRNYERISKDVREIDKVGTRVYAARLLMKYLPMLPHYGINKSKIDAIRQVAYG